MAIGRWFKAREQWIFFVLRDRALEGGSDVGLPPGLGAVELRWRDADDGEGAFGEVHALPRTDGSRPKRRDQKE